MVRIFLVICLKIKKEIIVTAHTPQQLILNISNLCLLIPISFHAPFQVSNIS